MQAHKTAAWFVEIWRRSGDKLPELGSLIGLDRSSVKQPTGMSMKALKASMLTKFDVRQEGEDHE